MTSLSLLGASRECVAYSVRYTGRGTESRCGSRQDGSGSESPCSPVLRLCGEGGWGGDDVSKIWIFVRVCVCCSAASCKMHCSMLYSVCVYVCVCLSSVRGDTEKIRSTTMCNVCPLALIAPLLFTPCTKTTTPNFLLSICVGFPVWILENINELSQQLTSAHFREQAELLASRS